MSLDDITSTDIESLIETTNKAIGAVSEGSVKRELISLKTILTKMQVALVEIENLEEKFQVGDITSETYFVRRKELVTAFFLAKNQITDVVIPSIAKHATSQEDESKIMKFKESLKNNREFVFVITDFLLMIAKLFILK